MSVTDRIAWLLIALGWALAAGWMFHWAFSLASIFCFATSMILTWEGDE